ncbi:MAG: hypothetical protein ABI461_06025, partial [Polyangiaceae bacterium]
STNDAVDEHAKKVGITLAKTRIGSPYVVASIENQRQDKAFSRIVGWEANGGFLVGTNLKLGATASLSPLASRDSTLPILANLAAALKKEKSLSDLWDELPARFGRAGLIDHFPVAASRSIVAALTPKGESAEIDLAPGELVNLLSRFFTKADGFGKPVKINLVDGIRVWFDSGDIAHIRPSGNAPQLRIYANASTQARADQIVELGLREPDGILRKMEKALV